MRCPDLLTDLANGQTGLLCFRGPNIFAGYLDEPDTNQAVLDADGWFQTGDLGRVNQAGYLFIEGRLSRFSKIGGEMVPHGKIEDEITTSLGIGQLEQAHMRNYWSNRPREGRKNWFLFTEVEIDAQSLRKKIDSIRTPQYLDSQRINFDRKNPYACKWKSRFSNVTRISFTEITKRVWII